MFIESPRYDLDEIKKSPQTPYTPPTSAKYPEEQNDVEAADGLLNRIESMPELTKKEKKEMISRCKNDADKLLDYLGYLLSPSISDKDLYNKKGRFEEMKNLLDPNVKIKVDRNYLSMDEFWTRIERNDLNGYDVSQIWFNSGEYIKDEYRTQIYREIHNENINIYTRKIKEVRLMQKEERIGNGTRILGIEDIDN